jgi:muramidase (phage lysozyme)
MEITHDCTCHACGRVLKRHRGKRSHCSSAACRFLVKTHRDERRFLRTTSPSAEPREPRMQALVTMAMVQPRTAPHTNRFTTGQLPTTLRKSP